MLLFLKYLHQIYTKNIKRNKNLIFPLILFLSKSQCGHQLVRTKNKIVRILDRLLNTPLRQVGITQPLSCMVVVGPSQIIPLRSSKRSLCIDRVFCNIFACSRGVITRLAAPQGLNKQAVLSAVQASECTPNQKGVTYTHTMQAHDAVGPIFCQLPRKALLGSRIMPPPRAKSTLVVKPSVIHETIYSK